MKLTLCTADPRAVDGEEWSVRLVRAYAALCDELHVVVLTGTAVDARVREGAPAHVVFHELLRGASWRGMREARTLLAKLPHDVLMALEPDTALRVAAHAARVNARPLLVRMPSAFFGWGAQGGIAGLRMRFRVRSLLTHATCVLLEREADRTLLKGYAPTLRADVHVLPPLAAPRATGSFDTGALHAAYPNLRFLLLTVVGSSTDKGSMKRTLAVFQELAAMYPWLGLLVLAPRRQSREARALLRRSGYGERVDVLDMATSYELCMQGADALLLLEESRAAAVHITQAAADGLPIVTTHANARDAGLLHNVSCLAVSPKDRDAAVACVRNLVEHNETRHRLAIGGRAAVPRTSVLDEGAWSAALADVLGECVSTSDHRV